MMAYHYTHSPSADAGSKNHCSCTSSCFFSPCGASSTDWTAIAFHFAIWSSVAKAFVGRKAYSAANAEVRYPFCDLLGAYKSNGRDGRERKTYYSSSCFAASSGSREMSTVSYFGSIS